MENTQEPAQEQPVKKLTYKDWEKQFGMGNYANTAKLTKEQYIAIKKKEVRSENAKRMFGLISSVAEKMTHNFRTGQMEGFAEKGGEDALTRLGKKSQDKALTFGPQDNQ